MPVTIEDVAREANVSTSTISRVINNSKAVSPELRERVRRAVEKTGYRPNALARSMITKRTNTVGLVVSDISNSVMTVMAKGINSVCQRMGYTVVICETNGKTEEEIRILEKLADHRIDGMVFAGVDVNRRLTDKMLQMDYPVVLVNQEESYGERRVTTVSYDNCQATYDAAKFLIAGGHTKIAYVGGPENDYSAGVKRLEGYRAALLDAGITPVDAYIRQGNFSFEAGYDGMQRIYEESGELPTAVMACSDLVALGVMQSVFALGLSVPEDISVLGFDDSEAAKYARPSLSTVRIPYFEEGILAAKTLMDLMRQSAQQEACKAETHYVRHAVIRRGSTRPMRRG